MKTHYLILNHCYLGSNNTRLPTTPEEQQRIPTACGRRSSVLS
jgi:hypothetical protein